MSLDDLLTTLERRSVVTPDTSFEEREVSLEPALIGAFTSVTPDTPRKSKEGVNVEKAVDVIGVTRARWWRFYYANREPKEASYSPTITYGEALAGEPDAIKAEPFEPRHRRPVIPLNASDETIILKWLSDIEETDEEIINAVLKQCQTDEDARNGYLRDAENSNENRRWLS
jgi:hypothetical protein